ncbi:hypothetical protein BJY00DRAFT_280893 [Aspergillus carlsbadensis]|nr:hypothetical protein BJY00DRAFT_280893 [Aspergillus carlsbadensis]
MTLDLTYAVEAFPTVFLIEISWPLEVAFSFVYYPVLFTCSHKLAFCLDIKFSLSFLILARVFTMSAERKERNRHGYFPCVY